MAATDTDTARCTRRSVLQRNVERIQRKRARLAPRNAGQSLKCSKFSVVKTQSKPINTFEQPRWRPRFVGHVGASIFFFALTLPCKLEQVRQCSSFVRGLGIFQSAFDFAQGALTLTLVELTHHNRQTHTLTRPIHSYQSPPASRNVPAARP